MATDWKQLLRYGSLSSKPSDDGPSRSVADGLEVRVAAVEARRGSEIAASVIVEDRGASGELAVGLVCRALYDEVISAIPGSSTRGTSEAVAHESWRPLPSVRGEHAVRLAVPPDAPFSYEGSCLSFRWMVVAWARRTGAPDAWASESLRVLP